MHSLDMFMQTALVFGAMRAIRATLLRILPAFDLQMTPHVPQPSVILAAIRTLEETRFLIEITGKFYLGNLRVCAIRIVRNFVVTNHLILVILVNTLPSYHP